MIEGADIGRLLGFWRWQGSAHDQVVDEGGRDAHYWAPPAQIRACPIKALGSHQGLLTPIAGQTIAGPSFSLRTRLSLWDTLARL